MTVQEAHLVQGSDAWLALRKTKVSGTDSAVILGVSPWKTQYQLWEQKLDRRPPDPVTPAMQRGTYLEPLALEKYEEKTGRQMMPSVVFSKERSWQMASLDGISFDKDLILEIKCGPRVYAEAEKGNIPDYYYAQMQHNMECSDVDMCHYFCWLPDKEGILIEVERDAKYIDKLLDEELAFFLKMQAQTPPEMTDKDVKFVDDSMHPFRLLEDDWLDAKKQLNAWEEKEKALRKRLIEAAGDHSCQGNCAKATRFTRKGNVQYDKIPELEGVDLEQYRKAGSTQWRLSEVKQEEPEF